MGAVYEGVHRDLKKRVAIKTLHPSVAMSAEARARFLREGEAASRINHPNVVDVTDVGTEGGVTYLVMEFLEGEDLAALIDRRGAFSVTEAVDVLLPVVGAIAVAHDEGVVHRDLKPGNVFMARTRHGAFKPTVLDFGISKLSAGGGSGNTMALTGTGAAMGTPYYVAPEQFRSAAGADARSDQYALGAILYECVTGRRAHQGESIYEVIRSVGEGAFARPSTYRPDLPPALEEAILRAMRLDPAERFASVQEFGRAILPFASPAAREQWGPSLGEGADGTTMPARAVHVPQAGGTVILPTPAPGAAPWTPGPSPRTPSPRTPGGRTPGPRTPSRSRPPSFGSMSGVEAGLGGGRRRTGIWIAAVVGLGGVAVVAYLLLSPAPRKPAADARPTVETTRVAVEPPARPTSPSRYRVAVTARPEAARFELDGKAAGSGRLVDDFPVDGTEHTLTVSAPGFVPAKLTFRDAPPPPVVDLDPLAAATPTPAHETHPAKPGHNHPHPHEPATHPQPKTPGPGGNNAAILD
jgi:serine/threonine-protein kinase